MPKLTHGSEARSFEMATTLLGTMRPSSQMHFLIPSILQTFDPNHFPCSLSRGVSKDEQIDSLSSLLDGRPSPLPKLSLTASRLLFATWCQDSLSQSNPFSCLVCKSNILEASKALQAQHGSYFGAVIYNCTRILPRKGVRGRVAIIGIACFKKGVR